MATIRPFKPIRPDPFYAGQLVFTKPQAESVSGDYTQAGGLKPLKTLLETGARLRPETPEGQEMAYRDINETLQSLLENGQLWREDTSGIFVYEVVHKTYRQTGIWTLTDLADYNNGSIKIHELTFADSIRRMKNYRENTGLEGSPVLLTYPADGTINAIIAVTKSGRLRATLGNEHGFHRLWKIEDEAMLQKLMATFAKINTVYLADGHHRLESAAQLAAWQRTEGLPVYDHIASLYMATDQLRVEEYNRVVVPGSQPDKNELLKALNEHFHMRESTGNAPVQPREPHRLGLYVDGEWYHLLMRSCLYETKKESQNTDAAILQEHILGPLFGIHDPKTDARLKYAGGEKALEEIGAIFGAHPGAIAFTLCPLPVNELIGVADAGHILPPKSTWIVPKVPYGLLIHQH
ncbi:MAG: DUF1015 domain-containing protein [Bacteroidota bacterium]